MVSQQVIIYIIASMGLTLIFMLYVLWRVDRAAKQPDSPVIRKWYTLKKSRFFFLFHKRKEGKIVRSVFWFWILYYISLLTFLGIGPFLIIYQTLLLTILVACAGVPIVIIWLIGFFKGIYVLFNSNPTVTNFASSYYEDEQKKRQPLNEFTEDNNITHLPDAVYSWEDNATDLSPQILSSDSQPETADKNSVSDSDTTNDNPNS